MMQPWATSPPVRVNTRDGADAPRRMPHISPEAIPFVLSVSPVSSSPSLAHSALAKPTVERIAMQAIIRSPSATPAGSVSVRLPDATVATVPIFGTDHAISLLLRLTLDHRTSGTTITVPFESPSGSWFEALSYCAP